MFPYFVECFVFDTSCVLGKLNSCQLTKEEAKYELDCIKETRKEFLSSKDKVKYSAVIEFAKIMIDLRMDVPIYREYVPYQDIFGRIYYVQKFVW